MGEVLVISTKADSGLEYLHKRKLGLYIESFSDYFDRLHMVLPDNVSRLFKRCSGLLLIHSVKQFFFEGQFGKYFNSIFYLISSFIKALLVLKKYPKIKIITNPWGHEIYGIEVIILSKLFKKKSVIKVAGGSDTYQKKFPALLLKIFRRLENFVIKNSDFVITASPLLLKKFPKYSKKLYVLPNICPAVDKYSKKKLITKNQEPFKLIFVGRLKPVKGVEILLESIAYLQKRGYSMECQIIGDGEMMDNLKNMAAKLELKKIKFWGYQEQEKVYDLIRKSNVLVLPSYSEFMPNVIIEAMAIGALVISSNFDGVEYLVEDLKTGLIFSKGDSRSLALKIKYAISHPKEIHEMEKRAQKRAEQKFSNVALRKKRHKLINAIFDSY
ncbi:MAG TPA: glycosyltransferase [Patescibacteria group bacterium]|nr:glycosyltransferase [Patescibacteria group bacterium]